MKPMLRLNRVTKTYKNKTVVDNLSIEIIDPNKHSINILQITNVLFKPNLYIITILIIHAITLYISPIL